MHFDDIFFYIIFSLKRHYNAIDTLANKGLVFWDYGNAFLLECQRAFNTSGCESEAIAQKTNSLSSTRFKYPS